MSSPGPPAELSPELLAHLALALVPGLGPKLTRAVLERFGSPAAVLAASVGQLQAVPLIGPTLASRFVESFRTNGPRVEAERDAILAHGVTLTLWGTPDYPERLTTVEDAPMLLYTKGAWGDADANAVGVVGSRSCTAYGKRVAGQIAAALTRAGYTVVSGLARGIDGAAHEGALAAGGRTVAVLGGGLAKIYPPEHAALAAEIARTGLLLTETPMNVGILPGMFPARNRIISALSRAVVVIEANAKSGSLITARHAAEQGREVFVVPGNVDSTHSEGCLELIRKGARLVRHADDILEDLRGIAPPDPPPTRSVGKPTLFDAPPAPTSVTPTGPPPGLDELQARVWDALDSPRHADDLARELGLAPGALSVVLMKLEMRKAVRRLPGNSYERR